MVKSIGRSVAFISGLRLIPKLDGRSSTGATAISHHLTRTSARRRSLHWCLTAAQIVGFLLLAKSDAEGASRFIAATRDRVLFEAAIEAERPAFTPPEGVTGITVPHHLLAADLIGRGFWAASRGSYDRVILISPDHFRKVHGLFATTRSNHETVFGTIESDKPAIRALLEQDALFEPIADVSYEHGLHSVAPFVKRFFPDAKIVPVIASISTNAADWRRAADAIASLLTDRTLVVQSTDYSHYLPLADAVRRDQETLSILSAREASAIEGLLQPSHMDSKAAQFIQLVLQRERMGGYPVVIANRNSAEYSFDGSATTSYVVTAYLRDPARAAALRYSDQTIVYFAGDTLLGRFLTPVLRDEQATEGIVGTVQGITRGAPLIVNLEGVLLDQPVLGVGDGSHVMMTEVAGPLLRRLGVTAASLANNHSYDLGELGFQETRRHLSHFGIRPLVHGEAADFGAFRLLPLSFVKGKDFLGATHHTADPSFVCGLGAHPPLLGFVHWGAEYTNTPRDRERDAAQQLLDCGLSVIIGAHSHQASEGIESIAGGALQLVYSIGNFVFDQSMPRSTGALLEARIFKQGTVATRLIPLPNLFRLGNRARAAARQRDGLK